MDLWIDCFGVVKLGVSEAAVHNGNTRLAQMHVELGYISILSLLMALLARYVLVVI